MKNRNLGLADVNPHAELALEERTPESRREIVDALAAADDLQPQSAPALEQIAVGGGDVDVVDEAVCIARCLAGDDDRLAFDRCEQLDGFDALRKNRRLRDAGL